MRNEPTLGVEVDLAEGNTAREEAIEDLAVERAVGTLLDLGVAQFKELIDPVQEGLLAQVDMRDVRHRCLTLELEQEDAHYRLRQRYDKVNHVNRAFPHHRIRDFTTRSSALHQARAEHARFQQLTEWLSLS